MRRLITTERRPAGHTAEFGLFIANRNRHLSILLRRISLPDHERLGRSNWQGKVGHASYIDLI